MSTYERINFLCKENHITGKEIGEKLGLKKSPLTDWKNNKSKPTIDQIKTICEIFAVSADYILFGKDADENLTKEKLKEEKIADITEEMIGHKLGEFAPTRTYKGHAGAKTSK